MLAQYGMKSWGRAEVAVRLIDEYSDDRKDQDSFINDCIEAASANEAFRRAKRFMEHECPLCFESVAMCNVSSLILVSPTLLSALYKLSKSGIGLTRQILHFLQNKR